MTTQSRTSDSRLRRQRARIGLQSETHALPRAVDPDPLMAKWDRDNPDPWDQLDDLTSAVRAAINLLEQNDANEGNNETIRTASTLLSEALAEIGGQ